ncbi:MAG: 30S ribosomal protein S17 [Candidatus Thermoplasmatota archaeon]|nr:30S ribosomal protein S17 [Candidatus Thermoplasmatota archaeon]
MAVKEGDIGLGLAPPSKACDDSKCPFHGHLKVRGQLLEGMVMSDRMQRTVTVRRDYQRLIPKYERFEKRSSTYMAHAPPCLDVRVGDRVFIAECRPLSKTVSYVVVGRQG